MARRETIEETISTLGETLRQGVSRHPSGGRLAAYHRDELSGSEMEALRDHLSLCPECSELLLDLSGFEQLGTSAEAQRWKQRQPAVWQALQSTLAAEDRPESRAPGRRRQRTVWLPLATAAILLLMMGATLWQSLDLGRTRDQLAATVDELARAEQQIVELGEAATQLEPLLDVPSFDLFPPGYRRHGEAEPSLAIPPQADLFVLQLHVAEARRQAEHRLRILTSEGVEVWAANGLHRTPEGTFRVALPRPFLPSGRYRLEVYDVGKPAGLPLAQYDLEIAYP